jgi:hypothetical protein
VHTGVCDAGAGLLSELAEQLVNAAHTTAVISIAAEAKCPIFMVAVSSPRPGDFTQLRIVREPLRWRHSTTQPKTRFCTAIIVRPRGESFCRNSIGQDWIEEVKNIHAGKSGIVSIQLQLHATVHQPRAVGGHEKAASDDWKTASIRNNCTGGFHSSERV